MPLLVALLIGVGALFWLTRDPAAERVPGRLAETRMTEPVGGFAGAWAIAERVLREDGRGDFTLRTLLADVPADRAAPPSRIHMAFRSRNGERDFFIQIDNAALDVTVSAVFPTSPRMRALPAPMPVFFEDVRIDLAEAVAVADAGLPMGSQPGVSADLVLRAVEAGPEWRISYSRESADGLENVGAAVVDARTGVLRTTGNPGGPP